jgi:hypothetical protein
VISPSTARQDWPHIYDHIITRDHSLAATRVATSLISMRSISSNTSKALIHMNGHINAIGGGVQRVFLQRRDFEGMLRLTRAMTDSDVQAIHHVARHFASIRLSNGISDPIISNLLLIHVPILILLHLNLVMPASMVRLVYANTKIGLIACLDSFVLSVPSLVFILMVRRSTWDLQPKINSKAISRKSTSTVLSVIENSLVTVNLRSTLKANILGRPLSSGKQYLARTRTAVKLSLRNTISAFTSGLNTTASV